MSEGFKNIKKAGKDLLEVFATEKNENSKIESKFTNKILLKELTDLFKSELEDLSVGRRMIYPMSFNIFMNTGDYNNLKNSLPLVLPEIVAAFYDIISDNRQNYPIFTPPARYWVFQFSPCNLNDMLQHIGQAEMVKTGHIVTIASLTSYDINNVNTMVETNTRVSIKCENSLVRNSENVNWEAFTGLGIISEGTFTYTFDKELNQDSQNIIQHSNIAEINGLATLSYYDTDNNIIHYLMKDDLISISGKNDMRRARSIIKIDNDQILDSHIQIKYISSEKKFKVAAYGYARLNTREMKLSLGGNVTWYDLADNSHIFINNIVNVEFQINSINQ